MAKVNLATLLEKFHAVSVREEEGRKIIREETTIDAPVVADPTLLLTDQDWRFVEKAVPDMPEKYILCYRFSDNNEIRERIDEISRMLGIPVFSLPLSIPSLRDNDNKVFRAGPAEFVWLIRNASLVCTDSFHATVFSLICETPFYVFLRENFCDEEANMNSRVMNLLKLAELPKRMCAPGRTIETNEIFDIDFSAFRVNVKSLRNSSITWLKNALDGDKA
jgi:hypothetical protein